eukprot:147568-Hanusia_phi.AAC.1
MITFNKNFRFHQYQSPFQICDKTKLKQLGTPDRFELMVLKLLNNKRLKDMHKIIYALDDFLQIDESSYDGGENIVTGCIKEMSEINDLIAEAQNMEHSITLDMYYIICQTFSMKIDANTNKNPHLYSIYKLYANYQNVIKHKQHIICEYKKLAPQDIITDERCSAISNILTRVDVEDFMQVFEDDVRNAINC